MEYGPGITVYAEGDHSDAVFHVIKGQITLSVVSERGKEVIAAVLNRHAFFGEACLIGQMARSATARTVTPCTLARIPKQAMLRALRTNRSFSAYFVTNVMVQHLRLQEQLARQMFDSSERRVARLLLMLARSGKDRPTEIVPPRVSQTTMAAMLGITRERVNYFMNKFRRLKFIEYNGHLLVHSSLLQSVLDK